MFDLRPALVPLLSQAHDPLLWDPVMDRGAPQRGAHRERLVLITRELFAPSNIRDDTFTHGGRRVGKTYETTVWDPRALYVTPTSHPAAMRATLRVWGGYDAEGRLALSTVYRDFSENHVPALRAGQREEITAEALEALWQTPAPLRALLLGADGAARLTFVRERAP